MSWFKKEKEKKDKEQIIAIKPVEFLGSNTIKILHPYKYFGFAGIDIYEDEYCLIITYPHFPPCDMTLYTNTNYNFLLIGIYKNCELTKSDGTKSWWDLPIIKLIKSDENINYDSEYSYDLLKKVFENIEIVKS
jgi:hypothetical protein